MSAELNFNVKLKTMNGPQDKLGFLPDVSSLTGSEEENVRKIEDEQILEYREEEVRSLVESVRTTILHLPFWLVSYFALL